MSVLKHKNFLMLTGKEIGLLSFLWSQPIRVSGEMWIQIQLVSLAYLHTRKMHSLLLITGSYCFDKWVAFYRTKRPDIVGQFHDESNVVPLGEEEHKNALYWAVDG